MMKNEKKTKWFIADFEVCRQNISLSAILLSMKSVPTDIDVL